MNNKLAKKAKMPERMCAACRKRSTKNSLMRVVKNKEGRVAIDKSNKAEGRGAYICADEKCIAAAEKKNSLARALKINIDRNIYLQLMEEIQKRHILEEGKNDGK